MKFVKYLFFTLLISANALSQNAKIINYSTLEQEFKSSKDSLILVNFWATTCKPCIEEFPYFTLAQEEYKNQRVKFVYVSMDFSRQLDKVNKFIETKGLKGKQFLLKDDPNVWINKVDPDWGGEIPYTFIVKADGSFVGHGSKFSSFDGLNKFIKKYKN